MKKQILIQLSKKVNKVQQSVRKYCSIITLVFIAVKLV